MNGVIDQTCFTVSEVAAMFRVSPATVVGWIERGELVASDVSRNHAKNRNWRIDPKEIESFRDLRMNKQLSAEKPTKNFTTVKQRIKR